MACSVRFNANASASAIVAFDTTSSCNAKCTMVWAICGRMPLMMHSARISREADTVLIRCWATSVSTVGTPVMSMMAIWARERLHDVVEEVLHYGLGALAVERAN
jgi:hypothetical protein